MDTSDKLVRFGKVLDIVGKVLAVLCLLAAVASLGMAVLIALLPENLILEMLDSIEVTSSFAVFKAGTTLGDLVPSVAVFGVKAALVLAALSGFVYCLVTAIILFILSALFKSTAAKRSPFLPENVKRLKIIGVILLIAALFLGLSNLIFAFCILALAFVFQYGTELQQQADETL